MQKYLDYFYKKMWGIKESIKEDITKLGDHLQYALALVFLIYSACFLGTYTSRVFIVSYLIANTIQILLKALFNNPRPRETAEGNTDNPDLVFDWSVNEGDSFPSGHTMAATIGGLYWLEIYPGWTFYSIPIIGVIGITLGLICALSRIIARAHWLRDVVTSSIISIIIYFIAKVYYL